MENNPPMQVNLWTPCWKWRWTKISDMGVTNPKLSIDSTKF